MWPWQNKCIKNKSICFLKQLQLSIKMFFFCPPQHLMCPQKNKPALIICFQRESWKQQTQRTLYLILSSFVCFSCVHQRDFFCSCLSGPEEPSRKEEEGQTRFVLPPLCTERRGRCKISKWSQGWRGTPPSALHPSVAWFSASGLRIFGHLRTSASSLTRSFFSVGLLQTLVSWNTNVLVRTRKKWINKVCRIKWSEGFQWICGLLFSVPLHLSDKPK